MKSSPAPAATVSRRVPSRPPRRPKAPPAVDPMESLKLNLRRAVGRAFLEGLAEVRRREGW